MEASTQLNEVNKLSNSSIGIGGNYNEKSLLEADSVVHTSSISKAEKRLKKLERDYQHTNEKYKKARSNSTYNYSFLLETIRSERHSGQIATCILHYNYLRAKLQNDLDKLNKGEARARGIDRHERCKQVSMMHSYKSLAQEKKILQQKEEKLREQHLENNDLQGQENIFAFYTTPKWKKSWEFKYFQSKIPQRSKAVHYLLRRFQDAEKLRKKAIANVELVNNPTSDQDSLTIASLEKEIKLLTEVIKKLEEESVRETRIDNGEEKMKHLEKICKFICRKMDEEKKYIVELKKKHDVL